MQPLTHHEIVALVEPLTRSGRQVDLAACQRLERRVAFRPVAHPAQGAGRPACTEAWHLDAADARALRLTRRLTPAGDFSHERGGMRVGYNRDCDNHY